MRYSIIFLKSLGIVFISSIIGLFLLLMVFALPTENMEYHVKESVKIFQKEGTYPKVRAINKWEGTTLDNFTDAWMLLMASYSGEESLLDKAINVYSVRIPKNSPDKALIGIYSDNYNANNQVRTSYGRYWHGYLVILKPLLLFLNYREIRHLNAFFVIITILTLTLLLYKKHMKEYVVPYLIALFLFDPFAIAKSLQFSSIYYIFTMASIIILLKIEKWRDNFEKFVLLFVFIGCLTSYFDLLSYPLVSFGIPATIYLCKSKLASTDNLKSLILLIIAWGFGYVGMWSAKWVIGTILGTENIIENAFKVIIWRSSMSDTAGKTFTFLTVLKRNFKYLNSAVLLVSSVYIVIMGIFSFLKKSFKQNMIKQKQVWLTFLFVGVLPFIWYLGASNHSYIHPWMTYREFSITIFALICMSTKNTYAEDIHVLERDNNR